MDTPSDLSFLTDEAGWITQAASTMWQQACSDVADCGHTTTVAVAVAVAGANAAARQVTAHCRSTRSLRQRPQSTPCAADPASRPQQPAEVARAVFLAEADTDPAEAVGPSSPPGEFISRHANCHQLSPQSPSRSPSPPSPLLQRRCSSVGLPPQTKSPASSSPRSPPTSPAATRSLCISTAQTSGLAVGAEPQTEARSKWKRQRSLAGREPESMLAGPSVLRLLGTPADATPPVPNGGEPASEIEGSVGIPSDTEPTTTTVQVCLWTDVRTPGFARLALAHDTGADGARRLAADRSRVAVGASRSSRISSSSTITEHGQHV